MVEGRMPRPDEPVAEMRSFVRMMLDCRPGERAALVRSIGDTSDEQKKEYSAVLASADRSTVTELEIARVRTESICVQALDANAPAEGLQTVVLAFMAVSMALHRAHRYGYVRHVEAIRPRVETALREELEGNDDAESIMDTARETAFLAREVEEYIDLLVEGNAGLGEIETWRAHYAELKLGCIILGEAHATLVHQNAFPE